MTPARIAIPSRATAMVSRLYLGGTTATTGDGGRGDDVGGTEGEGDAGKGREFYNGNSLGFESRRDEGGEGDE